MKHQAHCEVAVIGSGILGLSTALAAVKAGKDVTVFEAEDQPVGATIRNFGMLWPIGQPSGALLNRALRARLLWDEIAEETGLHLDRSGSLHLAYHEDEWQILQEFQSMSATSGYDTSLVTPEEIQMVSPATEPEGLLGGIYSRTEAIVDPREVPAALIGLLRHKYKVQFEFGKQISYVAEGEMICGNDSWTYDQAYVCCGANLKTLYPEVFSSLPITLVKLQMLRTIPQPDNWHMGPALAAGLTLQHYHSFADCPTLPALQARIQTEMPWANKWGIHVMMSQNRRFELIIGDSHEYGDTHDPFLREDINSKILSYLGSFARCPQPVIAERWHGVYAKMTDGRSEFVHDVDEQTTIITGIGGAGMTLSPGLAEQVVKGIYQPA